MQRIAHDLKVRREPPDGNAVALCQWARNLPVDDGCRTFVHLSREDLDHRVLFDHQRPVRQGVCAKWRQTNGLDVGLHDRPTGGEVMRRRAARRTDDDAVAADIRDMMAIDGNPQRDDAERRTRLDDAVVDGERGRISHRLTIAPDGNLENGAATHQRVVADHLCKLALQLVYQKLSQESELADVHTDQGDLVGPERSRDADECTIAA